MHTFKYFLFLISYFNTNSFIETTVIIHFKSLTCHSFDDSYAQFKNCELKTNKEQNMNVITIYLRLLQVPITNCKVQIDFGSNLVPFKFNTTWDGCRFIKNRGRFKALNSLYKIISSHTNLNHSCPYDHDIFVKDLGTTSTDLYFPVPMGLINFSTLWMTDGKVRVTVGGVVLYENIVNNKKLITPKK